MHPVDCVMQFLIPIDLSFWIAGLDSSAALFAGCAAVLYNTMAHSRLFAYDHLEHHGNEAVSYGIGIFMDKLFGTADMPLSTFAATWVGIIAAHYIFQFAGAYILVLPAAFMVFRTISAVVTKEDHSSESQKKTAHKA